ncbi:hypothetical protein [Pedobacter sp. JCM 36344]|uniref:hypothetical protein n=1 Tax=Pedobacter sp. JCM 36344 TaxID=3374280 RepID=UPI00397D36BC
MEISTLMVQICHLKPELEILALRYTADLEEGDELVQQTLIAALYKAVEFPEGSQSLKQWLSGMMNKIAEDKDRVHIKVLHNYFDDSNLANTDVVQGCKKALERRLRLYEDDLNIHFSALNTEHQVGNSKVADNV